MGLRAIMLVVLAVISLSPRSSAETSLPLAAYPGSRTGSAGGNKCSIYDKNSNELVLTFLGSIRLYQAILSSQDGVQCNFHPSCSRFGFEAIDRFGLQGVLMTSDRLLRCNGLNYHHYRLSPDTNRPVDEVESNLLWSGLARRPGFAQPMFRSRQCFGPAFSPGGPAGQRGAASGQFASADVRAFADHLYREQDFARAAAEYQRFLLIAQPDQAQADSVRMQIGICLRLAGELVSARDFFQEVLDHCAISGLGCRALTQLVCCDWESGAYGTAVSRLHGASRTSHACGMPRRTLVGVSHLLDGNWLAAKQQLGEIANGDCYVDAATISELRAIADEGLAFHRKSEVIAAMLSAVLPGSGKIYSNRVLDGLFALLIMSLPVWQSVDGFNDNGVDSIKGWIYGGLSLGFYAGNIYGSALAARQYNHVRESRLMERSSAVAVELSFRL